MTENDVPTPPPPVEPVPYASPTTPPPGGIFAAPPAPVAAGALSNDAKLWGMLCHLSALVQFVGPPSILGPLVIWLVKKNEIPFVDDQGKEAVNFHLTVYIAVLVLSPTICLGGLGIPLVGIVLLAGLVLSIVAGVKANNGEFYRYPFAIRFIK
jgi:uncharacterized Tic20 family protein